MPYRGYPAPWRNMGRAAGTWRNAEMLRQEHRPCDCARHGTAISLVVAFPGGVGTAHMVKLANMAGIEVVNG